MLERKRRARINRCLDELKEFILSTLQAEGENVSKLEKADILEFTVQHLHKLRRQNRLNTPVTDADRFRAGFTHCASEVSRCLASTPGVDVNLGTKLMTHLGHRLNEMEKTTPLSVSTAERYSPSPAPSSPSSISSSESYTMPLTPTSMTSSGSGSGSGSGGNHCSRNSSPCHPETHSHSQFNANANSNGLLTVVDMRTANNSSPVWRPW